MTEKALALVSKSICLNCLEECHCADRCPIKKPSGELEPHPVTDGKKKVSRELELCDITCFICHDKGHKSYSCPKKPPGKLELSDATCLKCHSKDHYTGSCPNKKPHGELEPYDDSHECQSKGGSEMVPEVSRLSPGAEDHCDRKSPTRSQEPNSDKANHAAMRDKAVTLVSKSTCFNCHEEGHYANKCTRKKPPKELELHDATHMNFHANSCPKKKAPGQLEVSDVTCFKCHDKGHKSDSCPKKSPGELEQSDYTCFHCHEKGHKSYSCPKKKSLELELSDVTCFKCHHKGHKSYSCPKKKPPRGLELSDTCFRCHSKGHYRHNCPNKKPPR